MQDQQPKRAVIFMRARWLGESERDRALEEQQIAMQRQACEQVAEQLSATVVRDYAEYGGTGAIERRPVLRQMLDELLALRDVDYMITASLDRLVHSSADTAALQLELETSGAELVIADGHALSAGQRVVNGVTFTVSK